MDRTSPETIDLEMIVRDAPEGHKPELRLWLRLLSTTNLVSEEIRRRLRAEFQTTLPQFDMLAQLEREPAGLRLGALSRRLMVTNGNVTSLVDRLVTEGLIERLSGEGDLRVTVARLTETGRTRFAAMAVAHERWLAELMAEVPAAMRASMLAELGTLKASVNAHLSTASESG